MLNTIQQFLEACHPFGYPLLACSVILFTAIFYHWKVRLKAGKKVQKWSQRLLQTDDQQQKQQYHEQLSKEAEKDEVMGCLHFIVTHSQCTELSGITESRLRTCIENARAGMSAIAIITNIAPMLGILGTAWGLVDIFSVFGEPGAQEGIALGISKALYTTIFGLAIAVPGIIAQICFERALEREAAELNEQFTYLLAHRNRL